MIVVDTNVIAYFWINGVHTTAAERVMQKDPHWVAPPLWRSAFRNVLAGYLRRKAFALESALRAADAAEKHLRPREVSVASSEILTRVAQSPCSAYDCEFVALADRLQTCLITADRKILQAFPQTAVAVEHFAAQF